MKHSKIFNELNWQLIANTVLIGIGLLLLLFYKLGSLTRGLGQTEISSSKLILGWHGLYHNPLYLPLNLLRSAILLIFPKSIFYLRLPEAIFGLLTICSFGLLVYLWHGKRVAYLSTLMFACSAWLLHISRLASYDILYLWACAVIILNYALLNEYKDSKAVMYLNLFIIGLLVTIPGLIWLSLVMLFLERLLLIERFKSSQLSQKIISIILLIMWLPLVVYRDHVNHTFHQWLGLPAHFGTVFHVLKDFIAVPYHLLIRGPLYPQLWLDRAPVLDAFALAMLLLGAYTYAKHRSNSRAQLLAALSFLSIILIGLNGSESFSLIIPIAYLFVAMGLGYLIHAWRKVFPLNPVAKWISITIIIVAVLLSSAYNLRSYFIAWPLNPTTYNTFDRTL